MTLLEFVIKIHNQHTADSITAGPSIIFHTYISKDMYNYVVVVCVNA